MSINYQGSGGGIPRKTAKIFGKNAASNDMTVFGSTLGGNTVYSSDLDSIQSSAYETGWRDAVISNLNYPLLSDMNGVQHTVSQQVAYILQHGIPEWDVTTTYYAYDLVQSGGKLYTSLTDSNTGNLVTDTNNWAVYYAPDLYVKKTGDEMSGNLGIINTKPKLYQKNSDIDISQTSTKANNLIGFNIEAQDTNDVIAGYVTNLYSTNGRINTYLGANRKISGTTYSGWLGVTMLTDGKDRIMCSEGVWQHLSLPALPSNTTEVMTLGATGATYTPTKNGYVLCYARCNGSYSYINIYDTSTGLGMKQVTYTNNDQIRVFLPVRKGATFTILYGSISDAWLLFVDAMGEEPFNPEV